MVEVKTDVRGQCDDWSHNRNGGKLYKFIKFSLLNWHYSSLYQALMRRNLS